MHSILAARSPFSIGESILSIEKLVDFARSAGETVVGLTDTMSVTGMIDFTVKAKKAGIKPIIGCRLRLVDDPTWRKTGKEKVPPEYYLTWYVLSEAGLKALFRLLSLANSEARFYYSARLSFEDLYEHLAGLTAADVILTTGDAFPVIAHPRAAGILDRLVGLLGRTGVFLNLTPIDQPYYDTLNKRAIEFAGRLRLAPIVTRPAQYPEAKANAHEVMGAISRNNKLTDPWHLSPYARTVVPLDKRALVRDAMAAAARLKDRYGLGNAGAWFKVGLQSTRLLERVATWTWEKQPVSLPRMAEDEYRAVVEACKEGWRTRFLEPVFGHQPTAAELAERYMPRLRYELSVIEKLSFSGYFLLVQDIVRWAKAQGILVGPGRGSVGGSLIAYLMGITDCDPIRFGLLFERFINPDRIDLPDADLDFMSARRHEIIDYLIERFGQARVAGISNFNSLAAAATIRAVGKAFGLPEAEYRCSKYVPKLHGANVPLAQCAEQVPEIAAFRDKYPDIWQVCLDVENTTSALGRHAAGVVVGGCDLVERAVIERRNDGATVNWDKRTVEEQGLVKIDVLGLSTLDLIKQTLDYIRTRHSARVDIMRIPLDDPKVLENFAEARTTGIFQFESGGMRRLLKELGADGVITFDDITAATALYRPGPMESGMMDSYWKRKRGHETVEYDHPLMEPILKPTFGVMVYQEQVMQISRVIAGYSAPDADKLRKIMGKKLPEEMKKERGKFVAGCVATIGATEEWAGALFDKIEGFAGYGFNKSHSVEYTLISYQAMWLKTYYPVEFVAAALSLMDEDKLPALVKEATRLGIEIVLPDINLSTNRFEILNDVKVCVPFNRVRGIADKTTDVILEARGHVAFTSMEDFNRRLEGKRRNCNVRHIATLDKIGAFASIDPTALPQRHPDRIRDQKELIPGLIADLVPVHRGMITDDPAKAQIGRLVAEYQIAHGPATGDSDGLPVKPTIGRNARFMVITDCPTAGEEREGAMAWGNSFEYANEALAVNGLARMDGYWTALIKRPKAGKQVTAEEIAIYQPYLMREIEILKPPVIVLLGSQVVRHFLPDLKGKASESAGKVVYSADLDANLVIGFNTGEIWHDPEKQGLLNQVFASVAALVA